MHVCRTDIFTADGVEAETQLRSFGINDDLLVFRIDGNDLADDATDGVPGCRLERKS